MGNVAAVIAFRKQTLLLHCYPVPCPLHRPADPAVKCEIQCHGTSPLTQGAVAACMGQGRMMIPCDPAHEHGACGLLHRTNGGNCSTAIFRSLSVVCER